MKIRPSKKTTSPPATKIVQGQPSWRIASNQVEAFVTETGGHLAPVVFDRKNSKFSPLEVAPWAGEKLDPPQPPLLQALRGDFFCMPFGGNPSLYRGENHPAHGETANSRWTFESVTKSNGVETLHLSMKTKVRRGRVDKYVSVADGQNAVYQKHTISGMSGPMTFGHHPIIKFPDKRHSGVISTSPFKFGQVFVEPLESPENRGYSALAPGAKFDSLEKVPTVFGTTTDLSRYPDRRGYEDIVILVGDPELLFGWTAVTFVDERQVWFSIKDPRVLRHTLFWISNGGRHYAPWNGRHINAMGLEELTSYFHIGLPPSVRNNPLAAAGHPTKVTLNPKQPATVNYIMATTQVPNGFDRVATIEASADGNGVILTSASGKSVQVPLDLGFLELK